MYLDIMNKIYSLHQGILILIMSTWDRKIAKDECKTD